jgi:undecaprenyl diphosphate synthase
MSQKKEELLELPTGTLIPNHIAIVLDGNRRWARARGLDTLQGHRAGFEAARKVAKAARDLGIHTLTVWGFSTENWDRSPKEIAYLMTLYKEFVLEVRKEAKKEGIRMIHLGRKDRFPRPLMALINEIEEETKDNKNHVLNVALDYGGKDEILRAVRKLMDSKVKSKNVDEKLFASFLDTGDQPYPNADLFIRPSGEQRTSGLMPWQMTYAEFYWEEDNLPDMTPQKLADAILDYSRRRRRFGGNDKEDHLKFRPEIAAKFEIAWWRLQNIPEGVKFREYAYQHIKEQFGLSTKLAKGAAYYMLEALAEGKEKDWQKAAGKLKKFYKLIKDEVKLAFEPSIVASLEIKTWQNKKDEEAATDLVAETYRISEFQAKKAGHLRVLAEEQKELGNWEMAHEYLTKYYIALKDRVA